SCSYCLTRVTSDISALSLHDALPIWHHSLGFHPHRGHRPNLRGEPLHCRPRCQHGLQRLSADPLSHHHGRGRVREGQPAQQKGRSEEHTSELQSLRHLVCRLLLEKKK